MNISHRLLDKSVCGQVCFANRIFSQVVIIDLITLSRKFHILKYHLDWTCHAN